MAMETWLITIEGVVQGIGLRPLIYRLATQYKLSGWVQNTQYNLQCLWQGHANQLQLAIHELHSNPYIPIKQINVTSTHFKQDVTTFTIKASVGQGSLLPVVCSDRATCNTCLKELFTPNNRRYQYPFISCTDCGPSYSITHSLPYDRKHTSMNDFTLCNQCISEYESPTNRRFHAQTISCPKCGPKLNYWEVSQSNIIANHAALEHTINQLKNGKIIAIKGIGGFHLMVDSQNDQAIQRLRTLKQRPDKPFALMVKDIEQAQKLCNLSTIEIESLTSPIAPIILAKKNEHSSLLISNYIAPGLNQLGVMLAYTPLHHLLLHAFKQPLVATSANLNSEPIIYNNTSAIEKLNQIADGWLIHDRDIINPLEDSILRKIANKMRVNRRARGYSTNIATVSQQYENHLALGGQLKNTIALQFNKTILLSPHLGDLDSIEAQNRFNQQLSYFKKLTNTPPAVMADYHPEYISSQIAAKISPAPIKIPHHLAHVAAGMLEFSLHDNVLGFAWDGLGINENQELLGAEAYAIKNKTYQHIVSMHPITLPGGEKAIKAPKRIALGLLEGNYNSLPKTLIHTFGNQEAHNLSTIITNKLNSPSCSSMGRLFDGIAALLGICPTISYEGQAAIELEAIACEAKPIHNYYPIHFYLKDKQQILDWRPMVQWVLKDIADNVSICTIALKFHLWLAHTINEIAQNYPYKNILLTGGVFQNKLLSEKCIEQLDLHNYNVFLPEKIPCNDGGLAAGQIAAYLLFYSGAIPKCA